MKTTLLHIFRNSPTGRENLMQSAYFCKQQFGLSLAVYIPETTQFGMDLGGNPVTVQLDGSYVAYPSTARKHAEDVLAEFKCNHHFYVPGERLTGTLPLLPNEWAMMTCPRVISEQSGRIGLGHIGPKVRALVKNAPFPVFIPSMTFKAWTSVRAFFGGSELGAVAVKEGLALARLARVPFTIHTQLDGITREECEKRLSAAGILGAVSGGGAEWSLFDEGTLEENLYAVPHDSVVVVGAAGHRLISELVFGSRLEAIQATLPNPFVVVGPDCRTPWDRLPEGGA
ncbi:MAG: universal stress protein [Phycisphaerae bacterium]